MTDRVQPGVKVDSALWNEFRQAVESNKGGVRGHLRSELETAIRLYINNDSELSSIQVSQRLSRIEAELGVAGTDGGADTFDSPEHTHTPVDEKPPSNAPTEKKVAYLAGVVREETDTGSGETPNELPPRVLRNIVKGEYGFRSDTAKRYIELLKDHFGLVDHPEGYSMLVSPERKEEVIEQKREQFKSEAKEKL